MRRRTRCDFNPRPPRGRRPRRSTYAATGERFQSTPSARRATPRTGRTARWILYFNPRPPRGERRCVAKTSYSDSRFQSTPSARRATPHALKIWLTMANFNPRPPRGERLTSCLPYPQRGLISIHALREESDASTSANSSEKLIFQSTPSARRATVQKFFCSVFAPISIHALREESDQVQCCWLFLCNYFNPRPPRGERQCAASWI